MPPNNPTSPKHHAIAKDQYMRRLMDSRVFGFLSKTERGVLLCYARHMNDRWSAWPGASRVAEQAGVSVGRAKIARAVLIRCGLLQPLGKVPGLAVHRYRVVETGWEDLTKAQRDEAATIPSRRRPGRPTTLDTGRACAPTAAATPGAPARHHRARQRATEDIP